MIWEFVLDRFDNELLRGQIGLGDQIDLGRFALDGVLSVVEVTQQLTRLAGGILILLVLSPVMRRAMHVQWRKLSRIWGLLLITVFLGTYLALWLQQVSLKYAAAGIAQTLFATSPLFVLPIALKMGERVTFRAVSGVVVALAGVAMLF